MLRTRSLLTSALFALPLALSAQGGSAAAPAANTTTPLSPEDRGNIFMARKMYREAIEQYNSMPKTAVIYNKIGIAYHQLLDLNTATRYYKKAVKANPSYSEAVNNLGTIYYAQKNYGGATRQYQKAIKLKPDSASYYSNLGTAYFARKKYKEATEAYQEALKIDPEVFDSRSSFGIVMQERTVEERAKYYYYLAKCYAQAGLNERSLNFIRRAMESGFKDTKKFLEEGDFAKIREMPEFQQLMAQQPRAL